MRPSLISSSGLPSCDSEVHLEFISWYAIGISFLFFSKIVGQISQYLSSDESSFPPESVTSLAQTVSFYLDLKDVAKIRICYLDCVCRGLECCLLWMGSVAWGNVGEAAMRSWNLLWKRKV